MAEDEAPMGPSKLSRNDDPVSGGYTGRRKGTKLVSDGPPCLD
jgi:hypothetical protein